MFKYYYNCIQCIKFCVEPVSWRESQKMTETGKCDKNHFGCHNTYYYEYVLGTRTVLCMRRIRTLVSPVLLWFTSHCL